MPELAASSSARIYTIGHSNRLLAAFLDLLKSHGAELLADVRKMPRSRRNPNFNMEALQSALGAAGIGYRHMPGLGGLRRPLPNSPNTGWRNASFQGYADYMQTREFEVSFDEFLVLAQRCQAVLMCAEALPWRCHRSLIADALVVRGWNVEHVLGRGRTQTHVVRPWAKIRGKNVTYPAHE
jgi:uncharacterized protein (DUF488 family)